MNRLVPFDRHRSMTVGCRHPRRAAGAFPCWGIAAFCVLACTPGEVERVPGPGSSQEVPAEPPQPPGSGTGGRASGAAGRSGAGGAPTGGRGGAGGTAGNRAGGTAGGTVVGRDAGVASGGASASGASSGMSSGPDAGAAVGGSGGGAALMRTVVWDGDARAGGAGWGKAIIDGTGEESVATDVPSPTGSTPNHTWLFTVRADGPVESGYNWLKRTTLGAAKYVGFFIKVVTEPSMTPPNDFSVSLRNAATDEYSIADGYLGPGIRAGTPNFADGQWHEVRVSLDDVFAKVPRYDAVKEVVIRGATKGAGYRCYIDEIALYE